VKVKILNHVVFIGAKGPESAKPGDILDLPDEVADMLVRDGDAGYVKAEVQEEPAPAPVEAEAPKPAAKPKTAAKRGK
jgi:hypothetical protein